LAPNTRRLLRLACALALAGVLGPHAARGAEDACREWRAEHQRTLGEVVRAWLAGAPPSELDAAIFELLQREVWLGSCDLPDETLRRELVGWRLVGRAPERYGAAVVESVLERAGFDPALGHLFRRRAAAAGTDAPR
jgi:hypothetical protein